jgi:hypothetical protein
MKRKKIDIEKVLKQGLPKMSKEDMEAAKAEVLERIRKELGGKMADFMAPETPASKAIKKIKAVDRLVLRSIQILEGKADLNKMLAIVNEIGDEPVDLDDIMMSLERLDRAKRLSLRELFPKDAEELTFDEEPSRARDLGEEKA